MGLVCISNRGLANGWCKYGERCNNPRCTGKHPSGDQRVGLKNPFIPNCHYKDNCHNPYCDFLHPSGNKRIGLPQCDFGPECYYKSCKYYHKDGMKRIGLFPVAPKAIEVEIQIVIPEQMPMNPVPQEPFDLPSPKTLLASGGVLPSGVTWADI